MKTLIIASIALIAVNASASCDLTLLVKKEGAKTAKLDGVSFSTKQIAALKTICNVNTKQMSIDEQVNDFKKSLEKRLEKAAKKAAAEDKNDDGKSDDGSYES